MAEDVALAAEAAPEPVAAAIEPAADIAPVVAEAPVAEAAPSIIEGAAETPAAEATEAVDEPAKVEAAPETPAKDAEKPKAPAEAVAEAAAEAPLPTYEDFTFPEGIQAAPEQIEAATGLFGKHHLSQEAAQEFVDLHSATITKMQADMVQHQTDVFEETKRGWRTEFAKEHGVRRDTVAGYAKDAVTLAYPNAEDRQRVWAAFRATGAGDHPAVVNTLARLYEKLSERAAPLTPVPPRANVSPAQRRYNRNIPART